MKSTIVCKIGTLLVLIILVFMTSSCPPPETEPPELVYNGFISLHYYKDPYVVTGKSFDIAVLLDSMSQPLGEYDFTISYDTTRLELNSAVDNGLSPGREGFITDVDVSTPGTVLVNGSDSTGTGPGMDLQILILHFTALTVGDAVISLVVNQLSTPDMGSMEYNNPDSFIVHVDSPSFYSLSGQVLDSFGGSPVSDALIELTGTVYSTTTGPDGFFTLGDVPVGVYDVMATKDGQAGSKVEQVPVDENETPVEIILPHYNYMDDALTPPSIFIRGILRNAEYEGIIPLEIEVEPGSCPVISNEFHQSIYLKISLTSMIFYEAANSTDHRLSFAWNTSLYPGGEVVVRVVAYDTNNNRSEVSIPVTVVSDGGEEPDSGNVPDVPPLENYYSIIANTYGRSLDVLRLSPDVYKMIGQSGYTTRAPADSTIIVDFSVEKYFNGVVVYRSFTEEGDYTLICQTSYTDDYRYRCLDYSPALDVDTTVYYKLAYYNRNGIGPQTDPISVRILPTYNLSLVSPSDNGVISDTFTTLSWTCEPFIDNARRTDWVIASNILDATIVAYSFIIDQTEYTLTDLLYNNTYEWDVRSYYEFTNSPGMANVLSRSFPRGNRSSDLSLNGAFMFTVIMPEVK